MFFSEDHEKQQVVRSVQGSSPCYSVMGQQVQVFDILKDKNTKDAGC